MFNAAIYKNDKKTSVSYIWLYKYTDVNEQLILGYSLNFIKI